jgi:hypothetical protein
MPTHPSYSQALSALVKCVRLRNVPEAVYWLKYLYEFQDVSWAKTKDKRTRTVRRLLILAAEDNFSLGTMKTISTNMPKLLANDCLFISWVAEVVRICKTPNWWAWGRHFIYSSLLASRYNLTHPQTDRDYVMQLYHDAVDAQDPIMALAHIRMLNQLKMGTSKQAEFVQSIATEDGASAIIAIHLDNRSALAGDTNYIQQAAYYSAWGEGTYGINGAIVYAGECAELIQQAEVSWKDPHPVPEWCCDGIHCGGNDPRFGGVLACMMGCCLAYEHYGRLDPADPWLPEFYLLDGLDAKVLVYPQKS